MLMPRERCLGAVSVIAVVLASGSAGMARSDDLWFHVRQAAGSHVILRRAGRKAEPDSTSIMEAAGIAAYYSKAGRSSNVPVCYTERRHVRKPRGAKPGLAVVSREKVVFVQPRLPGDSGGD